MNIIFSGLLLILVGIGVIVLEALYGGDLEARVELFLSILGRLILAGGWYVLLYGIFIFYANETQSFSPGLKALVVFVVSILFVYLVFGFRM